MTREGGLYPKRLLVDTRATGTIGLFKSSAIGLAPSFAKSSLTTLGVIKEVICFVVSYEESAFHSLRLWVEKTCIATDLHRNQSQQHGDNWTSLFWIFPLPQQATSSHKTSASPKGKETKWHTINACPYARLRSSRGSEHAGNFVSRCRLLIGVMLGFPTGMHKPQNGFIRQSTVRGHGSHITTKESLLAARCI